MDGVEYLPFQYNSSAHPAPTPALYVHIPKTQVIFVLAALVVGEGDTDARWSDGSLSVEQLDLSGHGGSFPDIPEGYAQPLHESRAVASESIAQMTDFYTDVFGQPYMYASHRAPRPTSDGGTV